MIELSETITFQLCRHDWRQAVLERFEGLGIGWKGYGQDMFDSVGDEGLDDMFDQGFTVDDIVDAEIDACR